MRTLWRISNYPTLEGLGGLRFSGRWHSQGHAIVYCSENTSSALNEMIAHQDKEDFPDTFQLLRIEIEEPFSVLRLEASDLPGNWRDQVHLTQAVGDAWIEGRQSLLLEVPSALAPYSQNVLINSSHPEAARCKITEIISAPLYPRFT